MEDRKFKIMAVNQIEALSLDELEKLRGIVQVDRKKTKIFLHDITLCINAILSENDALRTLTPETARVLGMPEEKVKLIIELQKKRKESIEAGNGDVVIRHRKTLTASVATGKHNTEGGK